MEDVSVDNEKFDSSKITKALSLLCVCVVVIYAWCYFLVGKDWQKAGLAFMLCSASFLLGALLGFMFTIFGDETEPFGKIRESMIALASGITGLGIAKAKQFGELIGSVHIFPENSGINSAFSILAVITFLVCGFFVTYFFRKLVLNPFLAETKSEMDHRAQISKEVRVVASKVMGTLPQSLLLGRDFIDEVDGLDSSEVDALRSNLYSDDVKQFLAECESDAKNGTLKSPHNISVAARLQYYRVYFEKKGTKEREAQEALALDWLLRALMIDPASPELQIKLADLYSLQEQYGEAIFIFERLERDSSSPQLVQQWLGYFLLFIDGREKDAISCSMSFYKRFPDESSALFNASRAYAQLYTGELQTSDSKSIPDSENRIESLKLLAKSIRMDGDYRDLAIKYADEGDSFASLRDDKQFAKLTVGHLEPEGNLGPHSGAEH